jgi:hypothetical protein
MNVRFVFMTGIKACSKCFTFKPFTSFYKAPSHADGKCGHCIDCEKQRQRQWEKKNQDQRRSINRRFRKGNPKSHQSSASKWKKANPAKVKFHGATRRAVERKACPPWAKEKEIADQILAHYEHAQWLFEVTGDSFHVDHIVPLSNDFVCGLHVPCNLMVLMAADNLSKNNAHWPGQLPCQVGRGSSHKWWIELKEATS